MTLIPGDHIRTERFGYHHHGIYVGDCSVVHFSHPPGHLWGARTLRRDDLESFNNKRPAEVVEHSDGLPRAEVLKRALDWVNTDTANFDLGANNCEHFANKCAIGKHYSRQAARGQIIFFVATLLFLMVGVGLVGRECVA